MDDEDGFKILDEAFRYDANPPEYRVRKGSPVRYATVGGPSEIIATPVVYKNRVYVPIGQDPEHGEGAGNIVCIDPTKTGDTTGTAEIWSYGLINRSVSTPSIVDDLLYVADYSGFVYCLDALTGELYWKHDTMSHIWGSTLVADGKVFIGNEDGYVTILKAGKELELIAEGSQDGGLEIERLDQVPCRSFEGLAPAPVGIAGRVFGHGRRRAVPVTGGHRDQHRVSREVCLDEVLVQLGTESPTGDQNHRLRSMADQGRAAQRADRDRLLTRWMDQVIQFGVLGIGRDLAFGRGRRQEQADGDQQDLTVDGQQGMTHEEPL